MIEKSSHIIHSKVFDTVYSIEENAHAIQNRLSQFSKSKLIPELDKILTQFSEDDLVFKFDQIILDIGTVSEEYLERDLLHKIKEELKEVLRKKIERLPLSNSNAEDSIISSKNREIEVLEWFLKNGTLPWWFKDKGSFNIKTLISNIMMESSGKVADLLKTNQRNLKLIKRVIYNFNENELYKLIQALSPVESELVITTGKNIIITQEKEQLIKTDRRTFRNKTWEFILTYIIQEKGSVFNMLSFVKSLLFQLAQFFNLQFLAFITLFKEAIWDIHKQINIPNSLNEIIISIYNTEYLRHKNSQNEIENNSTVLQDDKFWIKNFLERRSNNITKTELEKLVLLMKSLLKNDFSYVTSIIEGDQWKQLESKLILNETFEDLNKELSFIKTETKNNQSINYNRELEVLCYFLESGGLSLSFADVSKVQIHDALIHALTNKSAVFKRFVLEKGKQWSVRKRLILLLSEKEMEKLIVLVEPSHSAIIISVANNFQQIKDKNKIQVNVNNEDFKNLKWEFILEVLLVDKGSQFNLKSFVKQTVSLLSLRFTMDYFQLLDFLLVDLSIKTYGANTNALLVVLNQLLIEEYKERTQENKNISEAELIDFKLNWFQYVVNYQGLPWWNDEHNLQLTKIQTILFELSKSRKVELKTLIKAQFVYTKKRQFIISKLEQKGIVEIIRILEPSSVKSIQLYASILDRINKGEKVNSITNFEFKKWDVIIFSLIKNRGSYFNNKTFILSTLKQLTHHFAISFYELLTNLIIISKEIIGVTKNEFLGIIEELNKEFKQKLAAKQTVDFKKDGEIQRAINKFNNNLDDELKVFFSLIYTLKLEKSWSFLKIKEVTSWIKKNKHYPSKHLLEIIYHVGFSSADLHFIFGLLTKDEQTIWLERLVNTETFYINNYLFDFDLIFSSSNNLPKDRILHFIGVLSLSFLSKRHFKSKHEYFELIYNSIVKEWIIYESKIEKQLKYSIENEKYKLKSSIGFSYMKLKQKHKSKIFEKELVISENKVTSNKQNKTKIKNSNTKEMSMEKETIENSGLIIIWPFMSRLFKMLDMVDGNAFKSEQDAIKAVHLLQFVATDEEQHSEFDLTLNKVLCGLSRETVIDSEIVLTTNEKDICYQLLNGVIANWSQMSSSSVESIRETFLMRNGTLEFKEDSIELVVERKTVDILMDSMPWSISVIKLPWMDKVLNVVWM